MPLNFRLLNWDFQILQFTIWLVRKLETEYRVISWLSCFKIWLSANTKVFKYYPYVILISGSILFLHFLRR
jgi:hypothetical protein